MQYTRLGKSDLLVSRICMGCMGFGDPSTGQHRWTLDETASRDIIRHALEQGINFYDTAIAYQNGSSERYVGRALREMAKREEVVLATKFLPRTAAQIAEGISGKQAIARSLDQSLRNLGMDYIDLYIYHIWDYNTPVIDVLEALHTAVTMRQGARDWHFQLLCLAVGEGERPCRTRRADILCFCAEPLQPDYA